MMLWACSSDEVAEAPASASEHEIPISVSASARFYEDGTETRGTTRSTLWSPPAGYHLYEELYAGSYENIPDLSHSTIDLFMTHDDADGDASTVVNKLHTRLRYVSATETTTEKWKLSLPNITLPGPPERKFTEDDVQGGNYYAYGFVPRDAADDATITMLPGHSKWADGAVLTIQGMKAVAVDPCVIIGAKEGPDKDHDNGLCAGDFKFKLDTGKTGEEGHKVINPNYLYFLFDHLYSALSISMKVQGDYYALRKINLKALYLRTKTTSGSITENTDVTIELEKNSEGANPITSITYTPSIPVTKSDSTIYKDNAGSSLTTEYKSFLGYFMPQEVSTLILTSLYDVYDTKDNLIRKDCKATNTMVLKDLFKEELEANRGWRYHVNMTINPTYLYVLSEPDLDNPTVTVE
jgi:hypothetical protein